MAKKISLGQGSNHEPLDCEPVLKVNFIFRGCFICYATLSDISNPLFLGRRQTTSRTVKNLCFNNLLTPWK